MDKLKNFVIWLDGYLDAVGDDINISKTNMIKNKLNSLFEHEAGIEPNKSIEELGEDHGFNVFPGFPGNPGINDGNYRC